MTDAAQSSVSPSPGRAAAQGAAAAAPGRAALVRLPVEKPQAAVRFLLERGGGVLDLIAHFWERLSQTPPLQRADLHLVAAASPQHVKLLSNLDEYDISAAAAVLRGAMLYVPKAHRADVLALDAEVAETFAGYIQLAGSREGAGGPGIALGPIIIGSNGEKTEKGENRGSQTAGTIHADANAAQAEDVATESTAGFGGAGNGGVNGGGGVAIDFLTGAAEGVQAMVPHLLPLVRRRAPVKQLINFMMRLPAKAHVESCPEVRVAQDNDLPMLTRWRKLYKEERGIQFEADLDGWIQGQRIFVLEHDKQIVAVAKFDLELNDLVEIGGVFTFPEHRKRGFGTHMVSDLAARIRVMGKVPTLQTDVENIAAARLYQSLGWETLGTLARVWLTG